ncbi:MAG: nicotinate-nucleotide--dimethylbenzimidazole phosphoribosyltransferase [Firmicutes bacterium]|nr:nicotinate-nucleotide--dimethylbenzimidazole phosphoribosyltransferase [Bacillota bacterium]
MTRENLVEKVNKITPPDGGAIRLAEERQAQLAKPPGSLGKLEDISIKLAGITGEMAPDVTKQAIIVMSSDNGVCEEGVACAPQSVTRAQTINFTRRLTGVGALSKNFGVDLLVTDMGVKDSIPEGLYTDDAATAVRESKIWNRKIHPATGNIYKEAAMTEEEALTAIETGIEAAKALKGLGYGLIGIGEMGIGNTTTSTCLLAELAGVPAAQIVGKGGGLSDDGFARKKAVVTESCERAEGTLGARKSDPVALLAELGGFDIAAMAGAYIGAALCRIPVVIDGYISVVAALVADRIFDYYRTIDIQDKPHTNADSFRLADFMLASHESFERGYSVAIKELELSPMLLLGMRLGEGSGCPIAFKVIESAVAVMRDMATFEEAAINDEYLDEIRRGDSF